jgi:Ca-activated chloride channel family protein
MLSDLHFLRPWWLLLLAVLIAAIFVARNRRLTSRRWERVIDSQLLPFVLVGENGRRRSLAIILPGLAGALAIVALAGPVWKRLPQPVYRGQDAMVIALDLSRSMDVADMTPSRLARARFKIDDILDRRVEGQTALLVYAAEPFVVSPLTEDTDTIAAQLPALTTDLMPSQGTRADRALLKARELIEQAGLDRGTVLLVTDGLDLDRSRPVASDLRDAGIQVSVLGVGTADGAPIPGPGGFFEAADGSIIIASLERESLVALASAGGGTYQDLTADDRDVERLLTGLTVRSTAQAVESGLSADIWREDGPWLVLLLLPLVALAFRRGVIVVVAFLMIHPPAADAFEWTDLWARPDQRASRALNEGESDKAIDLFQDPAWKGVAEYRAGKFEASADSLKSLEDGESVYNRGNAFARSARFEEAIAAYDRTLEQIPDHADAQFNRDLLLEQMQNENQSPSESDQGSAGDDASGDEGERNADAQSEASSDSGRQGDQAPGQPGDPQGESDRQQQNAQQDPGEVIEDGESRSESEAQGRDESGSRLAQSSGEQQKSNTEGDMQRLDDMPDESEQAVEQWLRKIPDDPGGLLRRKFQYQYQRQDQPEKEVNQW